jgi:RNase P protein component
MPDLAPNWQIVINPRRRSLDAPFEELKREVEKVIQRCAKS